MNPEPNNNRPVLPTGTVTFLFTDIEGSTKLAEQYPQEMPGLLARHHSILSESIRANRGYIFKIIGDAFCAAFHSAADALDAALTAQRTLQHEKWHPAPIEVRMGIHTGAAQTAEVDDHPVDYTGYLTLARTQSIMSIAFGGQVLLSSASANLSQDSLPQGIMLRDIGEHQLKRGLNREHLWQLVAGDLRGEFPPLKTLTSVPNNLPVQLTSFVGRERELAQTKDLLASTHLLTLIGPGGTGKTRLTLQLAAEALQGYRDGAWLVELAPLADPAFVLHAIAAALGLREEPGASLKDLVTYHLHTRQLLLILDNCEHLIEICAQLSDHLLHNCPELRIIASSREALGIAGEAVYRVPPLGLPESEGGALETLRRSEAVQLFLERAAAAKPGFGLSEHNALAVVHICQRLDGIPLALELAAARIGMLTPQQIADRLDDRFRLLTGGSRTALPRQQTLRSLIDWSYDLLSAPERLLFRQLAVFVGGWSLEAAEAVCPEMDVLELLAQLVQKSLVTADERESPAATRFHLLETIRQYARDRLLEMETITQVRDRHLDYYMKFAEGGEANFFSPHRLMWVDQCELEHDNFRSALQWGLEYNPEAALRLAGSLTNFWGARGYSLEGRSWLQAALDRVADLPEPQGEASRRRQTVRAKGLLGSSGMSYGDGNFKAGLDASQEAVRLYRQLGDRPGLAYGLCYLGSMAAYQNDMLLAEQALIEATQLGRELGSKMVLAFALGVRGNFIDLPRGEIALARAHAEESLRSAREIGMSWAVGEGKIALARISTSLGEWEEARARALAALEVAQELRDPYLQNQAYNELGDIELQAGDLLQAQNYHRRSIVAHQELGSRAFIAHGLESFAFIAQSQNQAERTARLLGAADTLRETIGTSAFGIERLESEYERTIAWLHSQFDETDYRARWAEGRAMNIDQAIAYALNHKAG